MGEFRRHRIVPHVATFPASAHSPRPLRFPPPLPPVACEQPLPCWLPCHGIYQPCSPLSAPWYSRCQLPRPAATSDRVTCPHFPLLLPAAPADGIHPPALG